MESSDWCTHYFAILPHINIHLGMCVIFLPAVGNGKNVLWYSQVGPTDSHNVSAEGTACSRASEPDQCWVGVMLPTGVSCTLLTPYPLSWSPSYSYLSSLQVFFPMLSRLLEVTPTVDLFNLEETRVRSSNLLCKVRVSEKNFKNYS